MEIDIYTIEMIKYPAAEELQRWLSSQVAAGWNRPILLLLEHPHVYTFGRQGNKNNLLWSAEQLEQNGVSLHWTDRGGDITYHGPGQLVGYPILRLTDLDTLGYLRKLEAVIIHALNHFGIQGTRVEGQTGVWVSGEDPHAPPAKIASIGVRVDANRITRHGFALNVAPNMSYWDGMLACGLENQAKTSMANLLLQAPTIGQVIPQIIAGFSEIFDAQVTLTHIPQPTSPDQPGKV